MSTWELTPADHARADGLRRMRLVALSLLVFAAVVFIATLHRGGAWGYVNATAEAAMVGALADWFAVTALFRHPLGLPIPHTALIPKKKDVFAKSLEDFVVGYFLTGDAVSERYISSGATARIGRWLADRGHSERLVQEGSTIVARGLERIDEEEIRALVQRSLLPRLTAEPISPLAGALLEQVVADRVHHQLVDLVLAEANTWLLENPRTFMDLISERAPSWAPSWVNDLVTDRLHTEAVKWVRDVRDNPQHRVRIAFDALLADLATNLQEDPATMARAEALKERFLTHPQTTDTAVSLWEVLRRTLLAALDDPQGQVRRRAVVELIRLGRRLEHDPELRATVDRRVGEALSSLVQTYGPELAPVISQVIARWDGKEASERIELHVGRDLQFIRINGTIVGGLAGLVIHTLAQLAS